MGQRVTVAPVTVVRDGPVATLVMNRPERRNPLALDTIVALREALEAAGADHAVRAVVLGSTGPAFCAGHDLRELARDDPALHARIFAECAELMTTVHRLPVPVVARVQGVATAAGCQLVAACDLAVASEDAVFATPGVRIGLFCTTPAVEVVRAVGRARANTMLFTGDPIDAATAERWGLVAHVVPADRLDEEAAGLAARIASASRSALAAGKRGLAATAGLSREDAYPRASAVMCANLGEPDAREGIAAFLERRPPVWTHGEETS